METCPPQPATDVRRTSLAVRKKDKEENRNPRPLPVGSCLRRHGHSPSTRCNFSSLRTIIDTVCYSMLRVSLNTSNRVSKLVIVFGVRRGASLDPRLPSNQEPVVHVISGEDEEPANPPAPKISRQSSGNGTAEMPSCTDDAPSGNMYAF